MLGLCLALTLAAAITDVGYTEYGTLPRNLRVHSERQLMGDLSAWHTDSVLHVWFMHTAWERSQRLSWWSFQACQVLTVRVVALNDKLVKKS